MLFHFFDFTVTERDRRNLVSRTSRSAPSPQQRQTVGAGAASAGQRARQRDMSRAVKAISAKRRTGPARAKRHTATAAKVTPAASRRSARTPAGPSTAAADKAARLRREWRGFRRSKLLPETCTAGDLGIDMQTSAGLIAHVLRCAARSRSSTYVQALALHTAPCS